MFSSVIPISNKTVLTESVASISQTCRSVLVKFSVLSFDY